MNSTKELYEDSSINEQYRTGFVSLRGRMIAVLTACILSIICQLLAAFYTFNAIFLITGGASPDLIGTAGQNLENIGKLTFAIALIAIICLLIWVYRAYKNLPALTDEHTQWSPGWAVGGWVVPILNLWRPFQVIKEIWEKSANDTKRTDMGSVITGIWWGGYLVLHFYSKFADKVVDKASQKDLFAVSEAIHHVGYAALLSAGIYIFTMFLVYRMTTMQDEKARQQTKVEAAEEQETVQ